jgi:hypothetical protein
VKVRETVRRQLILDVPKASLGFPSALEAAAVLGTGAKPAGVKFDAVADCSARVLPFANPGDAI